MDSLEFKGKISFPFKVQEQPLEDTPVKSSDGHFLLVALFQEPVDNYCGHQKKKNFVELSEE